MQNTPNIGGFQLFQKKLGGYDGTCSAQKPKKKDFLGLWSPKKTSFFTASTGGSALATILLETPISRRRRSIKNKKVVKNFTRYWNLRSKASAICTTDPIPVAILAVSINDIPLNHSETKIQEQLRTEPHTHTPPTRGGELIVEQRGLEDQRQVIWVMHR
jgi:hypothetical protein